MKYRLTFVLSHNVGKEFKDGIRYVNYNKFNPVGRLFCHINFIDTYPGKENTKEQKTSTLNA